MSSDVAAQATTGVAGATADQSTQVGAGAPGVDAGVDVGASIETAPSPTAESEAGPAADAAESDWWVVVLETVSWGDSKRWGVGLEHQVGGDLAAAVKEAQRVAYEYDPQHPMSPRARTVYRADERSWLVVVEGRLVIEPFEVRVVARVGQTGRRGEGVRDRGR